MARQPQTPRAAGVRAARSTPVAQAFDALTVEGALIATAQLALVAGAQAEGQDETAYSVPRGLTLRDEIPRYFRIAQALWKDLAASDTTSNTATVTFVERLMRDVLGFADVSRAPVRTHDGRTHPVTLEALGGRVPVVVAPPSDPLDRPSPTLSIDGRRTSAALALQDWLNAAEDTLWGLACNGEKLRLVRDNPSLTRPAYIEADLRRMFEGDAFADFTALWLLLHASRFGFAGTPVTDCALERWRDAGQKAGVAARDRLRDGFEEALRAFGTGFLSHPANGELRRKLETKQLDLLDFHGLLLRLVYRLIFLLAAEDRNLLHPTDAPSTARKLYAEGYSVSHLRARSAKRVAWDAHDDLWDGLQIVFLSLARGEPSLALPALAGLFAHGGLGELESCALPNRALMRAIYRLAWLKDGGAVVPVNWRDMETEELGSVYEALLELTPRLADDGRAYGFAEVAEAGGHQRKVTSSYYTPDSLVQMLLDTALDPVLDRAERESEAPIQGLLEIKVIDPACGSGHFLLAAARRIATRVARQRAGGAASAEDYRHALRDVARTCIHGVDRNPMAVELTKVALWIETVEPGKPLGFLDSNIRCGDALLGVFDLDALHKGIPDAAYKPLTGDDPQAARIAGRVNRDQKAAASQGDFIAGLATGDLARDAQVVMAMAEDDVVSIKRKADAYAAVRAKAGWGARKLACDLYVSAFLRKKTFRSDGLARAQSPDCVPTTLDVRTALAGRQPDPQLVTLAVDLAEQARAFHWPLEFPAAMSLGGFDVVLGNPPWDTMSPDAKEFFSKFDPAVRFKSPEDQKKLISELRNLPGVQDDWDTYCRHLYVSANFFKESGRFKLFAEGNLGKGDFNVYRMFVELALKLVRSGGRAAQFVPENLYNGANAAAIRSHLFEACQLHALVGFENTRQVWFEIDTRAKFCLYAASPNGSTDNFPAAFGVNSTEKLAALRAGFPFEVSVALVREFSPEALAIAEIAHPSDLAIASKLYARFPKFGDANAGSAGRIYSRELDMGNDRDDFSGAEEGLPIYEGRMIEGFDHRAKAWVSGRGRAAVWKELYFGSPEKSIVPQWRLAESDVPQKIGERWKRYRIGFCDVASPTNQRAFVAALVPPGAICGHKVPTIELENSDPETSLLLLSAINSLCVDYIVRKKVSLSMTFTLVDSLPLPRSYSGRPIEREIARRALFLSATGPEMAPFWLDVAPRLGIDPVAEAPIENLERRRQLRAELDVLVARDLYRLQRDEMRYLLDPIDILGAGAGFETFGALKRADERSFAGRFLTRDLILEAWESLPTPAEVPTLVVAPVPVIHPSSQTENAWARPPVDITSVPMQTRVQVAAVLKGLGGPKSEQAVCLAAIYALEPRLLTARLDGGERAQWIRAVGSEAIAMSSGVVTFGLGGATGWADALQQLRAQNALIIDTAQDTWAPGPGLTNYFTDGWPERAGFALDVATRVLADSATVLTMDEENGIAAIAA